VGVKRGLKVASGHGFLALVFLYAKKSELSFQSKISSQGKFCDPAIHPLREGLLG